MRKTFRIIALAAVLGLTAVGCQKENIGEPSAYGIEDIRTVSYTIDGVPLQTTLVGDEAWFDFLHRIVALSEQGHTVYIQNSVQNQQQSAKETVTFDTKNRTDAYIWLDKMYDEGYSVSVTYDETTGIYHCVATK